MKRKVQIRRPGCTEREAFQEAIQKCFTCIEIAHIRQSELLDLSTLQSCTVR